MRNRAITTWSGYETRCSREHIEKDLRMRFTPPRPRSHANLPFWAWLFEDLIAPFVLGQEKYEADLLCADGIRQCGYCERGQRNRAYARTRAAVMAGGPPCVYCGVSASHVDHVLPQARGGTDEIENLAPACSDCNTGKGGLTPVEWLGTLEGDHRTARVRAIPVPARTRLTSAEHVRLAALLKARRPPLSAEQADADAEDGRHVDVEAQSG